MIVCVNGCLNFAVFFIVYKKLVFPFINEAQRVENAPSIFIFVLPSFMLISVVSFLTYKAIAKRQS